MQNAYLPWAVLALIMGILAALAVWARWRTRARVLAVIAFLSGVPIAGIATVYALGWPIPYLAWSAAVARGGGDFSVLGAKMVVGEGIFALLDLGGTPRYVVLPWDSDLASKLQELMESQREGETGEPRLKLPPFEFSWEKRKPPELYAMPQPKVLPPKPTQPPPTHFDSI